MPGMSLMPNGVREREDRQRLALCVGMHRARLSIQRVFRQAAYGVIGFSHGTGDDAAKRCDEDPGNAVVRDAAVATVADMA